MTAVKNKASSTQDSELIDRLWQAVLDRDRHSEAAFVYAVNSTGIYCRSSCPSRRPKREQVTFFPGAAAATAAGFRPCRRCRPDQKIPADRQLELVRAVCQHIQSSDDGPPTLAQLGALVGTSPAHLQRVFKALLGITPRQYADACRQDRFKSRLQAGWEITDAMYDAGYGSNSRLYEGSYSHLGMTPASYRRGGRGARIGYAIVTCPLGCLLVAATDKGLCAVKLGGPEKDLSADIRKEFPRAELHPDDLALGEWVENLVRHLDGKLQDLDLPIDVRATAFQRQVWDHLKTIPYGETRSYQQVADYLGRPGAARAVGRACAANPVAVVVPCHRVVPQKGGLGGYRWGAERKAALLARERAGTESPG